VIIWEVVHHLLENDQAKLSIFVVDAAEGAHIMYARKDAQLVDMERVLKFESIIGKLKLFKDKE
jgi:hypothetical protein